MDISESGNLYRKLQVLEPESAPLTRPERLRAINGPLLAWYEEHARILPWREDASPYRVWISEIMLQQTRVEAVKPYFTRFLEAFPDVKALAAAPEDRLLKLWEGLGYYNRARNLKKAAGIIMERYGGRVPDTKEELLSLPGIGSYTAGAIASIAYGKPEPAVDGNVLRVLSRVLASREDVASAAVKRQFEEDLALTMPRGDCSAFNQGLIEIGALVCLPNGEPRCGECPLRSVCLAARNGLTASIPYKAPKKPRRVEERTILLIESGDLVAIRKRPENGLLASMYEFPGLEGRQSAESVREALMHMSCGNSGGGAGERNAADGSSGGGMEEQETASGSSGGGMEEQETTNGSSGGGMEEQETVDGSSGRGTGKNKVTDGRFGGVTEEQGAADGSFCMRQVGTSADGKPDVGIQGGIPEESSAVKMAGGENESVNRSERTGTGNGLTYGRGGTADDSSCCGAEEQETAADSSDCGTGGNKAASVPPGGQPEEQEAAAGLQIRSITPAPEARHIFTHVEWHMTGFIIETDSIPDCYVAANRSELKEKYALPSAFEPYRKLLNGKS